MENGKNILSGPPVLYEPTEGGLGFEIFQALNANKGKIAQYIIKTGEIDTFDDLLGRSTKTAIFLQRKNLKKDDFICMCSGNNLNSLVPFIASQFVGTLYASLEPTLSENDIVYFLDYLKPKVLFINDEVEKKIEECLKKANIECDLVKFSKLSELFQSIETNDFRPVFVENLKKTALIFLTSGTTGLAKGICCSHYSILAQVFNFINCFFCKGTFSVSNFKMKYNDKENLKFMLYAPMYWISGLMVSIGLIFTGAARVIGSDFNAQEAWNALEKFQPDSLFLPPGQVNELCLYSDCKNRNYSVEIFIIGGGLITVKHMENMQKCFPNCKPVQAYGISEAVGAITSFKVDNDDEYKLQLKNLESCGKLIIGMQLKIVDLDTGKLCGINEQGEIRLKNRYVMNGYYNRDSSSAFDSEGWFKTGDLGYFDENGCIFLIDRIKDLLLYTLYNIRPSVIENILLKHPAVLDCFVFGFPHPKDNEHPMGIVLLSDEYKGKIAENEILNYVNERVPSDRYKIRAGVKFVEKMLKTPTGKLKKIDMKHQIIAGKLWTDAHIG